MWQAMQAQQHQQVKVPGAAACSKGASCLGLRLGKALSRESLRRRQVNLQQWLLLTARGASAEEARNYLKLPCLREMCPWWQHAFVHTFALMPFHE